MYQLLLSYGNQVEILEPAAVRQNMKIIVAGMNKTYST
jgi:predicted DNA-binding transcriptional regulator YafY